MQVSYEDGYKFFPRSTEDGQGSGGRIQRDGSAKVWYHQKINLGFLQLWYYFLRCQHSTRMDVSLGFVLAEVFPQLLA